MNTVLDLAVMDDKDDYSEPVIIATVVSDHDRLNFLPKYFGVADMIRGETLVYNYMKHYAPAYKGGYWEYYTLSNGGFYLAPRNNAKIEVNDSMMSGDAAGIAMTMFAIGRILSGDEPSESLYENYYHLRDYAYQHCEANLIHRVID